MDIHELVSEEKAYQVAKLEKKKEPNKHIWESAASYQDQTLFNMFLNLPQEQKKVVREVIMAMDKAYRSNRSIYSKNRPHFGFFTQSAVCFWCVC